ncbi:MAG: ABC transporter permease [Patescibacteria group bacterium]
MRIFDVTKLSLRMFKAHTMRTLLTILGMSVGISAIMFLVSFGYGLQRTLLEKITTSDALASVDVSIGKEGGQEKLDQSAIDTLKTLPNVTEVVPVLEVPGQGKFPTLNLDLNVVSSQQSFLKGEGLKVVAGRLFDKDEDSGLVISEGVAKIFNIPHDQLIGQTVSLTLFPVSETPGKTVTYTPPASYKIVGIVAGESNSVYTSLSSLDNFPLISYSKVKVKGTSAGIIDPLRILIEEKGFVVSSISETIDQANKVFRAVQIMLMIFGMIALVVSAIGMFNTMTITLLERTEEIGIMKAIGASRSNISVMFVMESTLMGFLGASGGIILGYLGGEIINFLINIIAVRFGGSAVDLFYSPLWFIGIIIAFGALVGFATGVFPARKAAKIDALDALRYK